MSSDAVRTTLAILLIAGTTIGAATGVTQYTGPLEDPTPPHLEYGGMFLVDYRMQTLDIQTDAVDIDANGQATFHNIQVPIRNVTRLEVTLRVSTQGVSAGDTYEVTVTDPTEHAKSGSHAVNQPTLAGYNRSATIVTWTRTVQPGTETYQAVDRDEAARFSAENHTDETAYGGWSASVSMNPRLFVRQGNVSLSFHFAYYEALILPKAAAMEDPTPNADPQGGAGNTTTTGGVTNTTATGGDPDPAGAARPPGFEALPRTFIMNRSVGETVDRGRPAERAL